LRPLAQASFFLLPPVVVENINKMLCCCVMQRPMTGEYDMRQFMTDSIN